MKTLFICILLFLFSIHSIAEDFWMQIDTPDNFVGRSMAANSMGWIFVGTNDGVYRSTENGKNLTKVGLYNVILGLTIDLNDNIYAGSNPIYLSTNNGDDWSVIPTPSDVNCIFTKDNIILYGFYGGIYKTLNIGEDWTQVLILDNTQVITSIAENNDGVMFAGITAYVGGGGVYRSIDNGDTWEHVGLWDYYIQTLAINSQGLLFAGSIGNAGIGIYSSEDNGESWTGLKNDVFVSSIVITPDDVIYIGCTNEHGTQGGVFRSFDDGTNWEMVNSGLIGTNNQNVYGLSLSPDGYLYAYGNHLHRSVEPVYSANSTGYTEAGSLKIFPNPVTDILHFEFPNDNDVNKNIFIKVFDITGKSLISQELSSQLNNSVNLSFLNPGLYFISIDVNGGQHIIKKPIIKQ